MPDDEEDDVLELTEEVGANDPPLVEGFGEATDVTFEDIADEPEPEPEPEPAPKFEDFAAFVREPEPEPEPPPPPPPPPPRIEPARVVARPAEPPSVEVAEAAPLLSQSTEGLVASAFNDLALTVLNRNARTLEDLVQDMLRPMLKAWLDQNLPPMVERLVKAEIERVTRGR
ncbi:MAG: DUF2497 domain-containing protein [Siculibacillus sp.]|nr:DUF2497 domain-containing protein [Siculibacillus sp.]